MQGVLVCLDLWYPSSLVPCHHLFYMLDQEQSSFLVLTDCLIVNHPLHRKVFELDQLHMKENLKILLELFDGDESHEVKILSKRNIGGDIGLFDMKFLMADPVDPNCLSIVAMVGDKWYLG